MKIRTQSRMDGQQGFGRENYVSITLDLEIGEFLDREKAAELLEQKAEAEIIRQKLFALLNKEWFPALLPQTGSRKTTSLPGGTRISVEVDVSEHVQNNFLESSGVISRNRMRLLVVLTSKIPLTSMQALDTCSEVVTQTIARCVVDGLVESFCGTPDQGNAAAN